MNVLPFKRRKYIPHYHGHAVRNLFIAAGVILLLTMPVMGPVLPISVFTLVFAVVVLIIFAALTNPRTRWVNIVNVLISIFGVVLFEFIAIASYPLDMLAFGVSQVLAIIFLFALYFSARTTRALATGELRTDKLEVKEEPDELEPGEEVSNEELLEDYKRGHGF